MERVLSLAEALAEVALHAGCVAAPLKTEALPLRLAVGRVLAEAICAPRDQPAFDRSTRDGFAVRADDLGSPLRVVGLVRAGECWGGEALQAGEAVEIMTGAPMPAGADAVLMVEHGIRSGDALTTDRRLRSGENVVARGSEAARGMVVVRAGQVLDAAAVGAAANCGRAEVVVFAQPVVAIVATGDELVRPGEGEPEAWQVYDSNTTSLGALVEKAGGVAGELAIARDTREDLVERIRQASSGDLILFSGGVSAGKYDLVEEVLAEHGAEFFFTGVKISAG